jgi:hypothetical protein
LNNSQRSRPRDPILCSPVLTRNLARDQPHPTVLIVRYGTCRRRCMDPRFSQTAGAQSASWACQSSTDCRLRWSRDTVAGQRFVIHKHRFRFRRCYGSHSEDVGGMGEMQLKIGDAFSPVDGAGSPVMRWATGCGDTSKKESFKPQMSFRLS